MIRKSSILPVVFIIIFMSTPQAFPQGQAPARPGAGVDQEPALTVQLQAELVEISPTGMRSLGRSFGTTMHAGEEGGGNLAIDQAGMVRIRARLVQIGKVSLVLDLSISDSGTSQILASRSLSLANRQEAIVELAVDVSGGKRLAVRFVPTIVAADAVQDYPLVLPEFGLQNSILTRNDKEVLIRIDGYARTADLSGSVLQFITLKSRRTGELYISYRPFPGASRCGYIEGKRMVFEWGGDRYEWISLDNPILPQGRWSLYVRQMGPGSGEAVEAGFTSGELRHFGEGNAPQTSGAKTTENADNAAGKRTYTMGEVTPPEVVRAPLPAYTPEARASRVEGIVVLQVVIRQDGTVDSVRLIKGLGYGLDEAAIKTIMEQWRFKPGMFRGKPVDVQANLEVTFRLR